MKIKSIIRSIICLTGCVLALASCDAMGDDALTTAAHAHSYGKWTIVQEATCTSEGLEERSCSCGEKETRTIDMIDHTIVSGTPVAATCMKDGKTAGKKCSVCNKVIEESKIIPAYGHDWVNYTCSRCGATNGLKLDPSSNDILTIDQINWKINSVGGVEPKIQFTNQSNKQIAYIWFTMKFYDRMGKPAYCSIKGTHTQVLTLTGPFNTNEQYTRIWDPVIYNNAVAAIKPLSMKIEYTDGTEQNIICDGIYWHSKDYYGGNLKD